MRRQPYSPTPMTQILRAPLNLRCADRQIASLTASSNLDRENRHAQVRLCPRMLTRELKDTIARNEKRWTLVM